MASPNSAGPDGPGVGVVVSSGVDGEHAESSDDDDLLELSKDQRDLGACDIC